MPWRYRRASWPLMTYCKLKATPFSKHAFLKRKRSSLLSSTWSNVGGFFGTGGLYRVGGDKFHPKSGALAGSRIKSDFAAEAFRAFLDDRQAHACALITGISSASLEWLKEAALHLGRDADAVVLNQEPNCLSRGCVIVDFGVLREGLCGRGLGPDADARGRIRRDEFECVGKKVGDDLVQDGIIGPHQ